MNPKFAAISKQLIRLAELDDVVDIVIGPCRNSLRKLRDDFPQGVLDVLFIDHAKADYVTDLKLCEELGLVGIVTTVIADNVISPGAPKYREYVQMSTRAKLNEKERQNSTGFIDTSKDMSLGNPYLVYETELINSFEPTGEPVST